MNNNDTNQTAPMCRLVCVFVSSIYGDRYRDKAIVLLCDSVVDLCFVVHYFVSIVVLQSS